MGATLNIDFFDKVCMHEVGPEARKVKRAEGDKIWKFRFPCYTDFVTYHYDANINAMPDGPAKDVMIKQFKNQTEQLYDAWLLVHAADHTKPNQSGMSVESKFSVKTVFVATFKNKLLQGMPKTKDDKRLVLTIKQTGLLTMRTFLKAVHLEACPHYI